MKRMQKGISLLLTLAMVLGMCAVGLTASAVVLEGDGTSAYPYQIDSYEELKAFSDAVNNGEHSACAVLTADIVVENNPDDSDWTPIGNDENPYSCVFDGQGYRIIGLCSPDDFQQEYVGLFGYIDSMGSVMNVNLEGGSIIGARYVGGIAGYNAGEINACSSSAEVNAARMYAAGIVGYNSGTIQNCSNSGEVYGEQYVAGIAGYNKTNALIQKCYNTMDLSGCFYAGGINGLNDGKIENCYNTGEVNISDNCAGGITGYNRGPLTLCYNLGDVYGNNYVGGIAGNNLAQGSIRYCYSTGNTMASNNVGGIAGNRVGNVSNCYYDNEKCSATKAVGNVTQETADVKGLTTEEMTGADAMTNMTGFSSEDWSVFTMLYPKLAWQGASLLLNGDGTAADPYEIGTYAQLKLFATIVNEGATAICGVVINNIEAKNNPDDEEYATEWIPIGFAENPYAGTFDGGNYVIAGISTPENADGANVGLFGYIDTSGSVMNVNLEGGSINGETNVGGISGSNAGVIENCSNSGSVTCTDSVAGGIAGNNTGAIRSCSFKGDAQGEEFIGGIAGSSSNTIQNCSNTGAISGSQHAAGIAGNNDGGNIQNCCNAGAISAGRYAAGIASQNAAGGTIVDSINTRAITSSSNYAAGIVVYNNGTVQRCYNLGNVTGASYVGGITAVNRNTAVIETCYSAGEVVGTSYIGGVLGHNFGAIVNCYYDSSKCAVTAAVGNASDTATVKGLATQEMTGLNALDTMTGFSSDDWNVSPMLYPLLKWQDVPLQLCGDGTQEAPFQLGSYAELRQFAIFVSDYGLVDLCAELTADIVAKYSPDDADYATDWIPIGNAAYPFAGDFDGLGHTITGISTPAFAKEFYVGLVGYLDDDGTVENIGMIDAAIIGKVNVGSIVGYNCGAVHNCHASGSVNGESCVGGLIGGNDAELLNSYNYCTVSGSDLCGGISGDNGRDGMIENCRNFGAVTGVQYVSGVVGANSETIRNSANFGEITGENLVGGIVADNATSGLVENCYNMGDLSGGIYTGGLIGHNDGQVLTSYNTGDITATDSYAGGLVAYNNGACRRSYNRGNVSAYSDVGGIAGENVSQGSIQTCYSTGVVNGNYSIGGVVASNNGPITSSYYDSTICENVAPIGNGVNITNVKGLPTQNMTGRTAFNRMSGFHANDWTVVENEYPVLNWQAALPITVIAHSLTLNGDIGVNFYADVPVPTAGTYASFTVDDETVDVPIDLTKTIVYDGMRLYRFTCNVAAAQIDSNITCQIINEVNTCDSYLYTVQTYLTEAQQTQGGNAPFMALAGSLATYGYYANELFDYNADFERHELFDDNGFADVTAASLAEFAAQIVNEEGGVNYVGSSLTLRAKTSIKHYFTLPEGKTIDDYTFLLGEGANAVELTPQASGNGFYCVEIPDIPSALLGQAQTVSVIDNTGSAEVVNTWTYSALSYVYKALTQYEDGNAAISDALADAVKALTLYYQAASAYFTLINAE